MRGWREIAADFRAVPVGGWVVLVASVALSNVLALLA